MCCRGGNCSRSFFFSSRRRHTRCSRDWSSDVCSSDLSERSTQRRPIRVVPMRGPGGLVAPAARVAAPPTAQLTYRGGPLLTGVEVVTVYWGAAWNEPAAQATAQSLNGFFQFVVSSPYIDQLGEYNTPQQRTGRGRYAGTT